MNLILLNDDFVEINRLKDFTIDEDQLIFQLSKDTFEYSALCYIQASEVEKSNIIVINYQKDLQLNSPKPSLTFLYGIIDQYNDDPDNKEFGNLLAPIQKLIEYDINQLHTCKQFNSGISKENIVEEIETTQQIITYQKFLEKEQIRENKNKTYIYADKTDLGFLIRFLLSRVGIISREEFGNKGKDPEIAASNRAIYEEEMEEKYLSERPDAYYEFASKKHIKIVPRSEARYYKSSIKRLSRKFSEFIELLIKGFPNDKIKPPKEISTALIYKYLSVMMLINYFAGREYNVNGEIIEGLAIEDDEFGYWRPTLEIIGKIFCYSDGKNKIPTVYNRINVTPQMILSNEDMKAVIYLTLFILSALKSLYDHEDDDTSDVEITFVRMFITCNLSKISFSEEETLSYFEKYFNDSGFSSKRNTLTQEKIITLDKILNSFKRLTDIAKKIGPKVLIIESQYENEKGKFILPKMKGQWVWHPTTGLTMVDDVRSPEAIDLYTYGFDPLPIASRFVIPVERELLN